LRKLLTTLGILLAILLVVVTILFVWQGENIKSILDGISKDTEEIEKQREENQASLVEDVNVYMQVPVREFTEEEKKQIQDGEITVTDVYQKIFEEKATEEENNAETPDKDAITSRYMAELYKLQNEYTAKAESLIKQGANYYESIKKHPQDAGARAATITHFTPKVRAMESESDSRVESVIKNLESELKKIGADTSIIATIRQTYENEKKYKLSYYANKYLK